MVFPAFDTNISIQQEDSSFIFNNVKVIEQLESIPILNVPNIKEASNSNSILYLVYGLYVAICLILSLRLIRNIYLLLFTKYQLGNSTNEMSVLIHSKNKGIYSFFNRLYIPQSKGRMQLDDTIIRHEFVHYKQLHSIDNILAEVFIIFFWFNPISWFLAKTIKRNHEYLSDQAVIKEIDSQSYIQVIISNLINQNTPQMSSNFSYLSIKKRIKMIQKHSKNPISQIAQITFVIALSILSLGLFSFKTVELESQVEEQFSTNLGIEIFEKPKGSPIAPEQIVKISSKFGMRMNPVKKVKQLHTGVDIIAKENSKILATDRGTIIKAEYSENYGNHIVIQHNKKYSTLYAHLASIKIKVGDQVEFGETIGIIGNSGKSIKTHLHYELIENGNKINPGID